MSDIIGEIFDKPRRRGDAGRVPDSRVTQHRTYVNERYTCPPDIHDRLLAFCNDEERAKSWVIAKALDEYLSSRGY